MINNKAGWTSTQLDKLCGLIGVQPGQILEHKDGVVPPIKKPGGPSQAARPASSQSRPGKLNRARPVGNGVA